MSVRLILFLVGMMVAIGLFRVAEPWSYQQPYRTGIGFVDTCRYSSLAL